MTRKYRLERTAFIGCRNTAYMDVDDAEPCPFCGSRQVTIYPYGQGTTSYVEGVPTLYLSSATCKCRGCTAEIDGPQRKSIGAAVAIRIYSVVPFKDSLELQTLNSELKRPPQSFCYVQSELDLPMKG